MVSLPGREWRRREHEDVAGQPQFRYPAVLTLMLIAVVFLIAAPSADWTLAVGITIEGVAMVITVATSRERESVRLRRALVLGLVMVVAVLLVALGIAPRWLTALIALAVTAGVPIVLVSVVAGGVSFNALHPRHDGPAVAQPVQATTTVPASAKSAPIVPPVETPSAGSAFALLPTIAASSLPRAVEAAPPPPPIRRPPWTANARPRRGTGEAEPGTEAPVEPTTPPVAAVAAPVPVAPPPSAAPAPPRTGPDGF